MSYQYPSPPSQNSFDMDITSLPDDSVSSRTKLDSGISFGGPTVLAGVSMSFETEKQILTLGNSAPQQPPPTPQRSAPPQDPPGLAVQTRRNKLGYHRTSVACGKFFRLGMLTSLSSECYAEFSSRPLPPPKDQVYAVTK